MITKLKLWTTLIVLAIAIHAVADEADKAIAPKTGPLKLFNGKNLDGLYTWLRDTKHEDPRKVFGVTDGMLHVSGDGYGCVTTKEAYRDYHLVLEFKWGEKTYEQRVKRRRIPDC